MVTRRRALGVLAGSLALGLSGCAFTKRSRYRMTVEVDTPDGLRSGFAVREIVKRTPPPIPMFGEDKGHVGVRGEAVAVDLPNGKVLFALLCSGNRSVDYAGREMRFIIEKLADVSPDGVINLYPDRPKVRAPIIADPLPMLVTFGDLNDPASVEQVDPDNLAASFDAGVKLKRITVEETEDDLTLGIEKKLAWLPQVHDLLRGTKFKPAGIPLGNFKGLFSTELLK